MTSLVSIEKCQENYLAPCLVCMCCVTCE